MSSSKVAAVVVTYNRKAQLLDCLNALRAQNESLQSILIIDNCSTDQTEKLLFDQGYIDQIPPVEQTDKITLESYIPYSSTDSSKFGEDNIGLQVLYIRLPKNTGGAGGFYEGVKLGHELGFDWLWLMDDDGVAEADALKQLLLKRDKAHFLNAMVIDIVHHDQLSFGLRLGDAVEGSKSREVIENGALDGLIYGQANPFNGTLISKELIAQIGYPKKEMFIWGDEVDYQQRASKSGLGVATVTKAVHYHPQAIAKKLKLPIFNEEITWSGIPFKDYCNIRNTAYIHKQYFPKSVFTTITKYLIYFLSKGDFSSLALSVNATWDGVFERWGREAKYLRS